MARQRRTAQERKDQIAAEALRFIAAEGASRLTALELARAVGVSDPALFRHFPSMEAIVDAAIDRFGTLLASSLDATEPDPVARLRAFFVHRLSLLRAHPEVLRLAFSDRLADAAGVQGGKRVRAIVARSRDHVLRCLVEARELGRVRREPPVEMLAWTVFGFMRGAGHRARPSRADPTPDEVWNALARMLEADVTPSSATRTPRSTP